MNNELLQKFSDLANGFVEKDDLIGETMHFIKIQLNVDAIGVRLVVGEDYPYYQTIGFSEPFVKAENSLCKRDACGNIVRDNKGKTVLACVCGDILRGKGNGRCTECACYLQSGGFVTNDSADPSLASILEREKISIRGKCIEGWYKTIVIIPIPYHNENIGLIQLNSLHENAFPIESIETIEQIGVIMGNVLGALVMLEQNAQERKMILAKNILKIAQEIRIIASKYSGATETKVFT